MEVLRPGMETTHADNDTGRHVIHHPNIHLLRVVQNVDE